MKTTRKNICQNRKAHYEYDVLETINAGIVLQGTEIKSIRQHNISLDGSYAVVNNGQLTLIGCHIDAYSHGNVHNHEPKRNRILLLQKKEIKKFAEQARIKGFTLVPLSVFIEKGLAKIELALCRGKQTHDKRKSIKERDITRDIQSYP